ncbi:MAG: hypothetical protein ACI36V_02750 [Coriobacteriales bacterium]
MAESKRSTEKPITIGSGTAYIAEFTGEVPSTETICVPENRLAYIKSGATITYSQESVTVQDDLGLIRKTVVTSDSATVSLGLLGWVGTTLKKLVSTARVTEEGGKRTVRIGGIGNDDGKSYCLCIHHEDKVDGDCWWKVVGKNTAGLELAYKPDTETAVNPTFTAEALDSEGTLVIYEESIGASG